jgi:hypothetical protein
MFGAQKLMAPPLSPATPVLAIARASVEIVAPTVRQSVTLNDAAIPMTCGNDVGAASQASSQHEAPFEHGMAQTPHFSKPWQASFAKSNVGIPSAVTFDGAPPKFPLVSWSGYVDVGIASTRETTLSLSASVASHHGRLRPGEPGAHGGVVPASVADTVTPRSSNGITITVAVSVGRAAPVRASR